VDQFKTLKVLELASVLAGPGVGMFFAELGADVIKVENLLQGGDVTRSWKIAGEQTDDRSAYFCCVNWGKRSIALDLTNPAHQKIVHRLTSTSDIVITSFKPGDAEKLCVDYKTLSAINHKMIYGQITGYGPKNPKVGYDAIIQAESGFMFMNGLPDGSSLKMPVALIDVLAGHHLKEGLLIALLERSITGKGQLVDVSLLDAAISSLANQATNWLVAKKSPAKHGSAHPNIAPYGDVFITADDKEVLLAVGNDRQFKDLCSILEVGEIADREIFKTNQNRVKNRSQLTAILAERIALVNSLTFVSALDKNKVPGGLIQSVSEVFETDAGQNLLLEAESLKGVRSYINNSTERVNLLPPPKLGEHTKEILATLDL
jgi:crotonobetainyl-CoA:carnitine CoA-transferase CaiB-like acyl-CoA transferase